MTTEANKISYIDILYKSLIQASIPTVNPSLLGVILKEGKA